MTKAYHVFDGSQYRCMHIAADAAINVAVLRWERGRWKIACRMCGAEMREPITDSPNEHRRGLN